MNLQRYADRREAGRRLGVVLTQRRLVDPIVLALPRGGVPVAAEVAAALGVALDVIIVRKLGVPWQPELALGAIGEGGVRVVNAAMQATTGVTDDSLAEVERVERTELERRAERYRGTRGPPSLGGRCAVIVDDGIATGATARAACLVARAQGASAIVLATPVAPPSTVDELRAVADEVVCLTIPDALGSVGAWYDDFAQVTDDEVDRLLAAGGSQAP